MFGTHSKTHRRGFVRRSQPALSVLVVAVVAVGLTAGCTKRESTDGADGVKLIKAGTLTVCTHLPGPPFELKDSSGKIVGFDIDLTGLVAKRLKLTPAIVDTPFEGIRSGQDLKTGKCDVAAAGMAITPERRQVMDFSAPYFDDMLGLLTKSGQSYKSLAALRGKRVGVQSASTGQAYARKHQAENGYTPVDYQDVAAIQQALATGQIQAALHDLSVWTDFAKKTPGYQVPASFRTGDQYGIAVAKGTNPKLLAAVNAALTTARQDGTYAKLYLKWIGTQPPSTATGG